MAKTVLITGGSRGIGYATTMLFARNGWQVMLCSRDENAAAKAASTIAKETGNAAVRGCAADMADVKSIGALFARTQKEFGALDALVGNAAILHVGSVFELSAAQWDEMMAANVTGLMHCCREAFYMMKKSGGSIVTISSIAGVQNTDKFAGLWAYGAGKAAVIGLSEGLAAEGRPYNIRVNCIAPGATDTDMLQQAAPGMKPKAVPADIAKIAYYLSDAAQSGILTGSTVVVHSDG
jgi:3-oxoacyl-[acyl-carrier protein] reductase